MSVFQSAILKKLQADTSITALVSTRIYPGIAPEGVTDPFITVNAYGPINADLTYGATISDLSGRFLVRATALDSSPSTVSTINAAIRTSLHNASLTITGMTALACLLNNIVEAYPEEDEGRLFWHEGSIFEVMAT